MSLDAGVTNLDIADAEYTVIVISITIYGTSIVVALAAIILFLVVQIRGRATFDEFPFFTIVWYLTLVNLTHLFAQAAMLFPCMYIEMPDQGFIVVWREIGFVLIDLSDQGLTYFILLMAVNRFAVFVWTQLQYVFSSCHIRKAVFFTLISVGCIVAYRQVFGTKKSFNKKTLNWDDVLLTQSPDPLINILSIAAYAIPLLTLIIYIVIYVFIRKQRSNSMYERADTDISLLYQAFAVSLLLEVTRAFAVIAPMMRTYTWLQWVLNISRSICSIINHMMNPILFMATNRTVQGVLRQMFRRIFNAIGCTQSAGGGDSISLRDKPIQVVMTC